MKNFKFLLVLSLFFSCSLFYPGIHQSVKAQEIEQDFDPLSTHYNAEGNKVEVLKNGIYIEYKDNGDITIHDEKNVLNSNIDTLSKERNSMIAIGRVKISVIGNCSEISYVTGYDLCRIVLNLLKTPPKNTSYTVYAQKIATHAPECDSSSLSQCINYGIKYELVKI